MKLAARRVGEAEKVLCSMQICFFAHAPEEVRHPATKPFVPPEALAAATTNVTLEALRKAAADSQKEAASASLVDALLKAHAGDNSQLLAQLEGVQGGIPGSSQVSSCMRPLQTPLFSSSCRLHSVKALGGVRSGASISSGNVHAAATGCEGLWVVVGACIGVSMPHPSSYLHCMLCRTPHIWWTH